MCRPASGFYLVLLMLLPADAFASGLPNVALSTEDPCLIVCPAGDFRFHVTIRDVANNPIPGSTVMLDFSQCPGFTPCPNVGDTLTWNAASRVVSRQTNPYGLATFVIHGGGVGAAGTVRIVDLGLLLATRALASPDQDGDLAVTNGDQSIVQTKVGSADPTADFDCSGGVTASDVSIAAAHQGHSCTSPTPTTRGSWGRMKTIYR